MHIQLAHEDECRWMRILIQIEQNRIALSKAAS